MTPLTVIPDAILRSMLALARTAPAGAFVEVGVFKGGSAWHLAQLAPASLHLFDTFTGIPYATSEDNHAVGDFADTSAAEVQAAIPSAILHIGVFPNTLPDDLIDIAFVHCDCDQYQSVRAVIDHLWPRMVVGGIMVFDDINQRGGWRAIRESFADQVRMDGVCYVRKS